MWQWLIDWLKRWWRKPPGQAVNLELDMANRLLQFDWPDVGPRQAALKHAIIDLRVDESLPWDFQDTVPHVDGEPSAALELLDVNPGRFIYRCTIVDVEDQPDLNPAETEISGAYDPPGSALNFTATDT